MGCPKRRRMAASVRTKPARAAARSVRMGRKPKLTDCQKRGALKRSDHSDETLAEIGQL